MKLGDMIAPVARKLGDSEFAVWSYAEVLQYLADGYVDLTYRSPHLWDRYYVDNLPYTANYNYDWEVQRLLARTGVIVEGQFDITYPWERNRKIGTLPAGNHTHHWERTPPIVDSATRTLTLTNIPSLNAKGFLLTEYIPATRVLPESVQSIRRATYDGHRIPPSGPDELSVLDANYENYSAQEQLAYTQSKDGLQTVRKYPVPSSRSGEYMTLTRWGSLRGVLTVLDSVSRRMSIDEFHPGGPTGIIDSVERSRFLLFGMIAIPDTGGIDPSGSSFVSLAELLPYCNGNIIGGRGGPYSGVPTISKEIDAVRGTLRIAPRHFGMNGPRGIVKRVIRDQNNFRLEVYRRLLPAVLHVLEVPRPFRLAIQFYTLSQAYRKRGSGQRMRLSAHYRDRYEMYVERHDRRGNAAGSRRHAVVSGGRRTGSNPSPGFPVYPDNFGYARFSLRRGRRFRR